jgi:hypothetical protein
VPFSNFVFWEFESVLDNQFKIRKPAGPACHHLSPAPYTREFNATLDTGHTSCRTPTPLAACHRAFKASPIPVPTPAPLSIASEAAASPTLLLFPSILLHHAAKPPSMLPPVSRTYGGSRPVLTEMMLATTSPSCLVGSRLTVDARMPQFASPLPRLCRRQSRHVGRQSATTARVQARVSCAAPALS